jgi:hypothetical protein
MAANTKDDMAQIKAATKIARCSHPDVRRDQYTAKSKPKGENGITEADAVAMAARKTVSSGCARVTTSSVIALDKVAGALYGFVSSLKVSFMPQRQGMRKRISVG